MTKDILPPLENEPLAVQTLYPDPEYFQELSEVFDEKKKEIREQLSGEPDIVGITHTDADGYGCEVMLREAFPEKDVRVVTASESGPLTVDVVGEYVTDNITSETEIYISDLSPNNGNGEAFIEPFENHETTVVDHHEWTDADKDAILEHASLIHDTERCGTMLVYEEITLKKYPDSPKLEAFAELTQDHDLWIKEQAEKSDALSDLAFTADREDYVEKAREHGVDIITVDWGEQQLEAAQELRERKSELAKARSTTKDVNDTIVLFSYGRCNVSTFADSMMTDSDVELVCHMYPTGKLSFRSAEGTDYARRIAEELGGGGHDEAAGAKPDFVGDRVEYTTHWATKGEALQLHVNAILDSCI